MQRQTLAMLKLASGVLMWGASYTAIKVAVSEVSPITLLWLRTGIGTAVLLLILFFQKRINLLPGRDLLDFALLGFLGVFLHNYIQSTGLETASAGMAGIIISSTPVVIAILGRLFLKEQVSLVQWFGIGVSSFGVLLVATRGNLMKLSELVLSSQGDLLVICSVFTWAVFSVISRKKLQNHPPDLAMLFTMASGLLFSTIPFIWAGAFRQLADLSPEGWFSVLFLGIFCSALAYVFWYGGLKDLPSSRVGIFLYLSPVVSVTVAAVFLSEAVTCIVVAGGLLVLSGVGLVNYGKIK